MSTAVSNGQKDLFLIESETWCIALELYNQQERKINGAQSNQTSSLFWLSGGQEEFCFLSFSPTVKHLWNDAFYPQNYCDQIYTTHTKTFLYIPNECNIPKLNTPYWTKYVFSVSWDLLLMGSQPLTETLPLRAPESEDQPVPMKKPHVALCFTA